MAERWDKSEVERRVAERILKDMDELTLRLMSLWDIGRALPHPYDAFGSEASHLVHDFNGLLNAISSYINLKGDTPPG